MPHAVPSKSSDKGTLIWELLCGCAEPSQEIDKASKKAVVRVALAVWTMQLAHKTAIKERVSTIREHVARLNILGPALKRWEHRVVANGQLAMSKVRATRAGVEMAIRWGQITRG